MTVQDDEYLAAQALEKGAFEEAIRLLQPLAEHKSEYALLALGWLFNVGASGNLDKKRARFYYDRAAELGSASAHLYLGHLCIENGDEAGARAEFAHGMKMGDKDCVRALANLNNAVAEQQAEDALKAKNYEEAARLLYPLAADNSERALLSLGWIHETGAAGIADPNRAREYYERAATHGSGVGCFELGRLLLSQGQDAQARAAFASGAERGDVPSMAKLGRMMVEGRGGAIDVASGTVWLEKAAEQGHILAQRTLLEVEKPQGRSPFAKIFHSIRIASLAGKGAREVLKNPDSDKLR